MKPICLSLVLLATLTAASHADEPEGGPLARDQRLTAAVTVQRGHIFLGELLDQLSRQAGVSLAVDTRREPLDGILLTVYVETQPLGELMEGLAMLFSSRHNRWEWRRTVRGYRLHQQRSLDEAANASRRELRAAWEAHVQEFHAIAKLGAPERDARLAGLRAAWPRGRDVLLPLIAAISADDIRRLLRDRQSIALDVGALPADAQGAYHRLVGSFDDPAGGAERPAALRVYENVEDIAPRVGIVARGSRSSTNLIGGRLYDAHWLHQNADGWRTPGDRDAIEMLAATVRGDAEAGRPLSDPSWRNWLKQAHEEQSLNVIADLVYPPGRGPSGNAWLGRTPVQTMNALAARAPLNWRQVGDLYLVRDPHADTEPREHLLPWRQVFALRRSAEAQHGFLSLDDALTIAQFTSGQVAGLEKEFPGIAGVARWKPIAEFLGKLTPRSRERLSSLDGLPWNDTGQTARNLLVAGGWPELRAGLERNVLAQPQNVRVRLYSEGRAARGRRPPPGIAPLGQPQPGAAAGEPRLRVVVSFQALVAGEEEPRHLTSVVLPEWKPLTPP